MPLLLVQWPHFENHRLGISVCSKYCPTVVKAQGEALLIKSTTKRKFYMSFTCKNRSTVFSTRLFTHLKKQRRKHPSILTSPGRWQVLLQTHHRESSWTEHSSWAAKCLTACWWCLRGRVHMLSHFQGKSVHVSFSSEQGLQCLFTPDFLLLRYFMWKSSLVTSRPEESHWKLSWLQP